MDIIHKQRGLDPLQIQTLSVVKAAIKDKGGNRVTWKNKSGLEQSTVTDKSLLEVLLWSPELLFFSSAGLPLQLAPEIFLGRP